MKKICICLLAVFLTVAALTSCVGQKAAPKAKVSGQEAKTYKVGMDAAYPPFGAQSKDKKDYEGFDVDIIKAIGKVEGFKVDISNIAFDGLIPALQTGNLDIVINDMTITEERAKAVAFSKSYYTAGLGLVVNKNNTDIKTKKDLSGKKVGVTIGSTGAEVGHKIPGAKVRDFNTITDALLELKNGGVDAVINDRPVNEHYVLTTGKDFAKALDGDFEVEYLGIAVAKKNTAILEKINHGLAAIKSNGEYAKIYKKWFGKEPPKEK